MDPISNVDRLALILRQKLADRAKLAKPSKSGGAASRPSTDLKGIQALAAAPALDDRQFKRVLIQSMLADQFGADLINEAKFQQVVGQVVSALEDDAAASGLLARVAAEVRKTAVEER